MFNRLLLVVITTISMVVAYPSCSHAATIDERVAAVQQKLGLTDVPFSSLKAVLLEPISGDTRLDQAEALVHLKEQRALLDSQSYLESDQSWTSFMAGRTTEEVAGYLIQSYPYASATFTAFGLLTSAVDVYLIFAEWNRICNTRITANYLSVVSDPQNDAEDWELVKDATIKPTGWNEQEAHDYCRRIWYVDRDSVSALQTDIPAFKALVRDLATGAAVIKVSPTGTTTYVNAVNAPAEVTFDSSFSRASAGHSIVYREWTWPEGSKTYNVTENKTYLTPGNHTVSLLVREDGGREWFTTVTLYVHGPYFSAEPDPTTPRRLTFTARDSQLINSYSWDFGDGSPPATQRIAEHTFNHDGNYQVTLTVNTASGLSSTSRQFHIGSTVPTIVSGTVTQDEEWTWDGGPYVVDGHLDLAEGVTLSIGPGTVVKFREKFSNVKGSLIVRGHLIARGTAESPIYFTSICDDAVGGDTNRDGAASVPLPGDWCYINALGSGSSMTLDRCIIRYGGKYTTWYGGYPYKEPVLKASDGSSLNVTRCSVSDCYSTGIACGDTMSIIIDTVVSDCGLDDYNSTGISVGHSGDSTWQSAITQIKGCSISGSGTGIEIGGNVSDPQIVDCRVTGCSNYGIYVSRSVAPDIRQCSVDNIGVNQEDQWGFGIYLENCSQSNVVGCQVSTSGYGIALGSCPDSHVGGCTTSDNWTGLCFWRSPTLSLTTNTTYRNKRGAEFYDMSLDNDLISGIVGSGTMYLLGCSIDGGTSLRGSSGFQYVIGAATRYIPEDDRKVVLPFCVDVGSILTIEPGTIVKFEEPMSYWDYYSRIDVKGTIVARGSADAPIYFTSIKDDSVGGDTNYDGADSWPSPGDWAHVWVDGPEAHGVFENCIFRYGGDYHGGWSNSSPSAALACSNDCTMQVVGCKIELSDLYGFHAFNTPNLEVKGTRFSGAWIEARITDCFSPIVRNCLIEGSDILFEACSYPQIVACTFHRTSGFSSGITFDKCSSPRAVSCDLSGANLCVSESTGANIINCTICNAGSAIYAEQSDLTVENTILAFNGIGVDAWYGCNVVLKNNCFYDNLRDTWDLPDPTVQDGNIWVDPRLASLPCGDLHLQPDSPCIDRGEDSAVQNEACDRDGQIRIQGNHVDIGADESDGANWAVSPSIIHVSSDGDDNNDGSTWTLAKRTIQAAIHSTVTPIEIWVKAGIYSECVEFRPYVYLYGGFRGDESSKEQRNPKANTTVLDGGGQGTVVSQEDCGYRLNVIDGFTITNGGDSGILCEALIISNNFISRNYSSTSSGGIGSCMGAVISNNIITDNTAGWDGGGVSCSWSIVSGNIIENNSAGHNGAGISCSGESQISNNTIRNNTSFEADGSGGGIYCSHSKAFVGNNIIAGNGASRGGGISTEYYDYANIINNTITANQSDIGGGVYSDQSSPTLVNNIIAFNDSGICKSDSWGWIELRNNCVYGNGTLDYSGMQPGSGDVLLDPRFIDRASGNYHLVGGSPCIEAGDDSLILSDWVDIDGRPRILGDHVDIGADEYDGPIPVAPPAFNPEDGNYTSPQSVVVTCTTTGVVIHYTTNGIEPTESDPAVASGSAVTLVESCKLMAKAWKAGREPSATASATYALKVAKPTFSLAPGMYPPPVNVTLGCATPGSMIHYATNGEEPTPSDASVAPGGSITLETSVTLKAKAFRSGCDPSDVETVDYLIRPLFTVAEAKVKQDGVDIACSNVTVSAVFEDCFYVEAADRSSGIRMQCTDYWPWTGALVDVVGITRTSPNGERYIEASIVNERDYRFVSPLGMSNKSIGGADWHYNQENGAGQRGVKNGSGLNNVGLLVRAWGKVTHTGFDDFYIDDGSGMDDGSGHRGIRVLCNWFTPPPTDSFIQLSGISTCFSKDGDLYPLIRMRSEEDITISNGATIAGRVLQANIQSFDQVVECQHPYPNDVDQSWTITAPPQTEWIRVHFSRIELPDGSDYIELRDASGNVRQWFGSTTAESDVWSDWVEGDSLQIRLVSDSAFSGFGFLIDRYEVGTYAPVPGVTISLGPEVTAVTDGNGYYAFSGLSPGDYVVKPSSPDILFYPAEHYISLSDGQFASTDFEGVELLSVGSIGKVKSVSEPYAVSLSDKIVTAVFPYYFYIEDPDRSSGIRVESYTLPEVGNIVSLQGYPYVDDYSGEVAIWAENVSVTPAFEMLQPLGMNNKAVGGDLIGFQKGISGGFGLNNIGLLVCCWGKFTYVDSNTFTIDDGSGVNVKCVVPDGVVLDQNWTYVSVTGISSCEMDVSELNRLVRVRKQTDIVSYQ